MSDTKYTFWGLGIIFTFSELRFLAVALTQGRTWRIIIFFSGTLIFSSSRDTRKQKMQKGTSQSPASALGNNNNFPSPKLLLRPVPNLLALSKLTCLADKTNQPVKRAESQ